MNTILKNHKIILAGLFLIIINFISISGNLQDSIALPAGDDGILSHVYASVNPEKFKLDQVGTILGIETSTSIINWLPYISYKWFEISPLFFWYLFLFIQISILPISMFLMYRYLLNNFLVAILFTIITVNVRPQMLNLTYSGDLEWMPYAGWLSLGFSVLALYIYLTKSLDWAFGVVLIVSLIHPIFGIWLLFAFIIATRTSNLFSAQSRIIKFRILLFTICIFLNLTRLYRDYMTNAAHTIPTNYVDQISNNAHFNSLKLYQVPIEQYFVTNGSILSILGLLLYIFANLSTVHKYFDSRFKVFMGSTMLTLGIGFVSQLVGIYSNNLILMRLLGIRLSGFLSVLIFLIFLVSICYRDHKLNYKTFILISGLILFPGAAFFFIVGVYSFWIKRKQLSVRNRIICNAMIIAGICSSLRLFLDFKLNVIDNFTNVDMLIRYVINSHLFVRNYFIEFIPPLYIPLVFGLAIALLYLVSIKSYNLSFFLGSRKFLLLSCAVLFLLFSAGRYNNSIDRFTLYDKNFVKVQNWVRSNTSENSTFYIQADELTYSGWRNFTNRPKINIVPEPYPYAYYKSDLTFELRYANSVEEFGYEKLSNPDFDFLRSNGLRFGIDYIVCDRDFITGNADIVFMNDSFKVVKL